jgi:uroporphyrinogen III methyltransferase/synthase
MSKKSSSKTLPLHGRRVVITRRKEQASILRTALEKKGAKVIALPTIAIVPPRSWKPLDGALGKLDSYDWLIFTSTNGVDFFFERLRKKRKTVRALRGKRVAAIGPATARALRQRGVKVKVVPEDFIAEGLLKALGSKGWKGKRVLLARAAQARQILPRELRKRGATVHVVPVYQTILPPQSKVRVKSLFAKKKPDAITFTSSSTVKNFFAIAGRARAKKLLAGVVVATIGPVTSRTARALGLKVAVEARTYTIPGLAQALARHFQH